MAAKTKKKGAIAAPTKKTMNFVHHKSSFNPKKVIPAVIIVLILGALFAKFGILDQLDKKTAAYNELGMKQDQLNAVIDWVKQQDFCDPHNLFLFGESQGGFVTAITGAEHSQDVKAMVLFYPAMCIQDDMRKQFPTWEDVPDEFPFMGTTLSKAYYEGLYDYDPYAVAGQFTGHVLIVHGDRDRIVSISYGQMLAACYQNAEFVTLPGEDHGFSAEGKKKSTRLVYNFLEKQKSMASE